MAVKLGVTGLVGAILAAVIASLAVSLKCWRHWEDRGHAAGWASDEAYYLGLLYTLISLILAIVQLFILEASDAGPENLRSRTIDLIGNFGIALTSTVAGILGRILLQTRSVAEPSGTPSVITSPPAGQAIASPEPDSPYESPGLETPLSWDVREQLQALRRNLFEAADGFAHFTRVMLEQADGTRASAERVIEGFNERLAEIAQSEVQGIATNWQGAIAAMRNDHETAVVESKRELLQLRQRWTSLSNQTQTEIERLTERFDAAATQSLQQTEAGWSRLTASLAQSAEAMRTSSISHKAELNALLTDLSGLRQRIEPFGAALVDASEAVTTFQGNTRESIIDSGDLRQVLQDAKQTLLALNDTTKRVDADLVSQVAEMGKAHRAMVDSCKSLIADVDALCRIALESIADRTQDATTTLGQAANQADSLKAKIEGLASTLDAQRNKAERTTAQFESLLGDVLRNSTDTADDRIAGGDSELGAHKSIAHSSQSRANTNAPIEPKSRPWWPLGRGGDPS
ncbi:MAG: hypothetical protein F4X81_00620 [Gammaproteobacteria bacterium]|nr:hypothetical protein [Gammaproteobacteria bacterium]MYE49950.1 hypothetical protein [Gammaproteobacteria bacterium]MYF48957.1 hypothetical protein [Gammaproteobacteria bacterium]MYH14855.1 hypothetical protein [Gammaproteobacteria bacterium]MYK84298.1 hypothetical protein [Gammaproteobacteria bacterium]